MAYHSTHLGHHEIRDALLKEFTFEEIKAMTCAEIKNASTRKRGVFRKGNRVKVFTSSFIVTLYQRPAS
jgi:hypothetical protein